VTQPTFVFVDHTAAAGGAELGLLRYLLRAQTATELILLESGPIEEQLRAAGYRSITVLGGTGAPGLLLRLRSLRGAMAAGPEKVYVSNSMRAALFVSLLRPRRTRHVYYVQDGLDRDSLESWKRWVLRHVTLPRVHALLCNSEWTHGSVPRTFRRLPTRIVYSLSGVPQAQEPSRTPSPGEPLHLLSLSRIVAWKGIDVLLDAVRSLCDEGYADRIALTIAGAPIFGEPGYYDAILASAASLPCPVDFPGQVDDVSGLLRAADILVHASRRPEPFGQVVVQGMAAGAMVVATRGGGPQELIADGIDGFLYEAGNAGELADRLRRALVGEIDLTDVRAAAVQKAKAFTDPHLAKLMDEALTDLAHATRT
jgi:glycosyltransferase involved in cell wall biosynthesis